MASEIGALSHIFRDIDVLVLSARRPSLAAPPCGPQVGRYLHSHHSSPSSCFLTKFDFNILQMPYIKVLAAHQCWAAVRTRGGTLRFASCTFFLAQPPVNMDMSITI